MVHASYCAPYPKWPCVKHEANMCCPCYMMSFCSRTFYFLLSSSVINVVTTPSDVTDVTVWPVTSNPNPRVLKIEEWQINQKENKSEKENKKKLSSLSVILTHTPVSVSVLKPLLEIIGAILLKPWVSLIVWSCI